MLGMQPTQLRAATTADTTKAVEESFRSYKRNKWTAACDARYAANPDSAADAARIWGLLDHIWRINELWFVMLGTQPTQPAQLGLGQSFNII